MGERGSMGAGVVRLTRFGGENGWRRFSTGGGKAKAAAHEERIRFQRRERKEAQRRRGEETGIAARPRTAGWRRRHDRPFVRLGCR